MFVSNSLNQIILLFVGIVFSVIGFVISIAIIIGVIVAIVFAIKAYMKKFNALEQTSEKRAQERHQAAEEEMRHSALKHEENMAEVEKEMLAEKVKCSYCGKHSLFRVGTDFTCPYCGANAIVEDKE